MAVLVFDPKILTIALRPTANGQRPTANGQRPMANGPLANANTQSQWRIANGQPHEKSMKQFPISQDLLMTRMIAADSLRPYCAELLS